MLEKEREKPYFLSGNVGTAGNSAMNELHARGSHLRKLARKKTIGPC